MAVATVAVVSRAVVVVAMVAVVSRAVEVAEVVVTAEGKMVEGETAVVRAVAARAAVAREVAETGQQQLQGLSRAESASTQQPCS